MENNSRNKIMASKVAGLLFLIVFSLAFIFACLKNVLPIGNFIVGTFGILTYPLMIIFAILSLAKALGLSYTRDSKATALFLLFLTSVIYSIHSIATFKALNLVIGFKTLGRYLSYSYASVTLAGSFGSIFCGLISMLLGGMGTIIVCVILATLFIGLFVDYELYGKYEKSTVRKLKSRKLREKVSVSDKVQTADGKPEYSFSGYDESQVIDEITMNENDSYNQTETMRYSENDVVGEISDTNENPYYTQNNQINNYQPNDYSIENEIQRQNEFTTEFYTEKEMPDIYSGDMNEHRRQFMEATFGKTYQNPNEQQSQSYEFENNQFSGIQQTDSDSFDISNQNTVSGYNDELSKILNSKEEEIDAKTDMSVKDDFSGYQISDGDKFDYNQFNQKPVEKSEYVKPEAVPQVPEYKDFSVQPFGAQNTLTTPKQNYENMNQFENVSISNTNSSNTQPVVSQKPISSQKNSYGINIAMPGVRYNPPPLNLLRTPKQDSGDYTEEQSRKSTQLENVLASFNVPAKVKNIVRGPKITRYELAMPLGTSVKKIPTYENDIAAALAAKTIVIKAPIPGSQYVGIELENDTFTSVYERELLESEEFQNAKDPLPIAIGKDISGEIVVKSMAKMVHLLIAGSTGSGKSVFIHNIVLSLIYKYGPDDLRLIMIDPKKVEFNRYNGLPHLLTPEVVMGADKAINALKWCVKEMDRRYDLMNKAGYNNIEPYNKSELVKAGQFEHMPYIVIIVDELAEIMIANKKESEVCIQRITQLARACGMHLILATQRPSVDIISGVIKNNIPSRIAFSLQSGIDSKTILNSVGAEKLLGQGDMIFAPTGTSSMPRLQAAYASDDEIKAVIDYDKKYNQANYDERVESSFNAEQSSVDDAGGNSQFDAPPPKDTVDNYFKTAVKLVMMNGGASTSYLQRRLSIGYARAARIVDQMEDKGYIAPSTGSKLRKVLITPEQFKEDFGEDYNKID